MSEKRDSEGFPSYIPYEVSPHKVALVMALAKKSHKACCGTGVVGWLHHGREAVLCSCVRRKLATMQRALEEQQAKLTSQIEDARAERNLQAPEEVSSA